MAYSKLIQFLGNPTRSSRSAFILGCGRSGTTMLARALAQSPSVDFYNEDHPDLFRKYHLLSLTNVDRTVDASYARLVVIKPILDTHRAVELLNGYPDSLILYAFRHYSDVINSSRAKWDDRWFENVARWVETDFAEFEVRPPEKTINLIMEVWRQELDVPSGIAVRWLFYNHLYYDLGLDTSERVKLVRYGSLAENPATVLSEVTKFLGIPFNSRMAKGIHATSIGKEAAPIIDNVIDKHCSQLWHRLVTDSQSTSADGRERSSAKAGAALDS